MRLGSTVFLALSLLSVASCGSCGGEGVPEGADKAGAGSGATDGKEAEQATPRQRLLADVDARRLSGRLREAALGEDVALRRIAVWGLGWLHDPAAAPLLAEGLRDPDAEVRDAASFGLGSLTGSVGSARSQALLGSLAAEADPEARAARLWDLGRVGLTAATAAFQAELEAPEAVVRAGACDGLAEMGLAGRPVSAEVMRRAAAHLVDDPAPAVRAACAEALSRVAPPAADAPATQALAADLLRALRDEQPEVRAAGLRALMRYADTPDESLARATGDPDYRVAIQAFRALAAHAPAGASDAAFAASLRRRMDRALGRDTVLEGPELQVFAGAFQAASRFASQPSTHGVAVEALERLGSRKKPTPDEGRAHCAAALLADQGAGWPREVRMCGLEQVSSERRKLLAVEVLAASGQPLDRRAAELKRMARGADRLLREAILAAVPAVGDASLDDLVLEGLEAEDRGVITAATQAVEALAPRWLAAGGSVASAAAPLDPPMAHRLRRALRRAERRLVRDDYVAGLLAWLDAVDALRAKDFVAEARKLARYPSSAVRRRALAVLGDLGAKRPGGEPPPPPHPLPATAFAPADVPMRARLETSRGAFEVELWPARAPGTVARFVQLAESGAYDGTPFFGLVPGFALQGGDPRGDGHGGPDFRVRSEENRARFDPGTLGMALAGRSRDTAGSQFFVTLAWSPQLRGRYTAFGKVTSGLDVVQRLQEGDRLQHVEVSRETP